GGQQSYCAFFTNAINSIEEQFFFRVGIVSFEAIRWIGEIKIAIGFKNQIVRAVQAAELIILSQSFKSFPIQSGHAPVPVLAEDEAACRINGQPVGTRFS